MPLTDPLTTRLDGSTPVPTHDGSVRVAGFSLMKSLRLSEAGGHASLPSRPLSSGDLRGATPGPLRPLGWLQQRWKLVH